MKISGTLAAAICLLLILFSTIGAFEYNRQIAATKSEQKNRKSTIEDSKEESTSVYCHDGILPSVVQVSEVQIPQNANARNFLLAVKNLLLQTTCYKQTGYFKYAQPMLYDGSPPIYLAIRILLI